jgi:hypothetical protein
MKRTKIFLIGVGNVGTQAINKLNASGISASTMLIHDDEHTPPDALAFKFLQDAESMEKLRSLFQLKINNLKLDIDDMVIVIAELGSNLSSTISTLKSECAKSGLELAVMGITQRLSNNYEQEMLEEEYIQEKLWPRYLIEFPIEAVYAELEDASASEALDCIIDYICHVAETILNGKITGYSRISDMTGTNYLPNIFGLNTSYSNILIGKGKDSATAFKEAIGNYNQTDCNAVAFSVTGSAEAIEEAIDFASQFYGVDNLWLTHRLQESETETEEVQVTMMVA